MAMADNTNDAVDPVLAVLTEFEQKLRILHQNDQLVGEAQRTFGSLVTDLERRTHADRRSAPRSAADRRQTK